MKRRNLVFFLLFAITISACKPTTAHIKGEVTSIKHDRDFVSIEVTPNSIIRTSDGSDLFGTGISNEFLFPVTANTDGLKVGGLIELDCLTDWTGEIDAGTCDIVAQ